MASITAALAGLVSFGLTVTGIGTQSYDLKGFFDAKQAGSLSFPCLLAVPDLNEQQGFLTQAMGGNAPKLDFILEHYLLFSNVAQSADITVIMPQELAVVDSYFVALKGLPFFTSGPTAPTGVPVTHQPTRGTYRILKSNWYGVQYHSILFRHKLEINL